MRLFFSAGCPFAHRTRALLTHLAVPFEPREIDLKAKPPDFLALSPSGKVPLLEDDGFVLYESAIINEYLAERLAWQDAFSPDLRQRARERLAMTQFDQVLSPHFYKVLKDPAAGGPEQAAAAWREVDELARTAKAAQPASLLGFHLAGFWLRWNWLDPASPVVARLRAADGLGGWLDQVAALAAVQATAPDRGETVRATRQRLGLAPL